MTSTICETILCLYSQIYLAKKLSKQVASTAVLGAVINVVINVIFIKKLGLYAAAISTTISYFVMMIYRHFDMKKYVNITIEKSLILKTILIFTVVIYFYYQRNLYLNILSLALAVIYSILLNRKFLLETYENIAKKLFSKNK